MLIEFLWPAKADLAVDAIKVSHDKLLVVAHGTQETACCPNCQKTSARINSHYWRHPADLPCIGYTVQLSLKVPRFFCENERCPRLTFAAKFPALLNAYARRTKRLAIQQQQVGFTVSAETGSRLLQVLGMLTSPDTLIRLVRQAPEPEVATPRVLGVDDWAFRKGQSYGTILVDLEKHQVIDLLSDRTAESLIKWLEEHPGIEVISRDRGSDYIEGATKGAPEATQIADRFHLFQNVVDTLKRALEKQPQKLREAAGQVAAERQKKANQAVTEAAVTHSTPVDGKEGAVEQRVAQGQENANQQAKEPEIMNEKGGEKKQPTLRELRFTEVKALQAQGWSRRAIAKHLNMHRKTVRKYFAVDTCPQRFPVSPATSTVKPYFAYLLRRWQEGCQNIKQLHEELKTQGFQGHYASVYRAMQRLLKEGKITKAVTPKAIPIPNLSVTEAAWLLVHPDDRLNERQLQLRDKLCQVSEETETARLLTQSFCALLRERQADKLDTWLDEAEQSDIKAFKNFAVGLRRDYDAVKAAMTYEWSQGQVEGQVNRLKFIKRQMYGRAKFDLLRKRVIGAPMLC